MATRLDELPYVKSEFDIPQSKLIKVLLINPNSTKTMTQNALKMVQDSLPLDAIVYGYTAPVGKGPTTIEGHLDGVLSATSVMRDAYDLIGQVDACLVACFSDHPLTNCIREEFDIPVCGIMEAAIYSARVLGARFGIIATVYRSEIRHADAVKNMGLDRYCAGVKSTGLKVSELELKPRLEVLKTIGEVAAKLVDERDADALILGCCGMSDMKIAVEDAVKHQLVPVLDGVVSGVNLLSGIVRSNGFTSKRGLFCSSKASRQARGQDYL
jgi:Asp/Glu/hydantoin racemase